LVPGYGAPSSSSLKIPIGLLYGPIAITTVLVLGYPAIGHDERLCATSELATIVVAFVGEPGQEVVL